MISKRERVKISLIIIAAEVLAIYTIIIISETWIILVYGLGYVKMEFVKLS